MTAPLGEWERRGKTYVAEKWTRLTAGWLDLEDE